MPPPSIFHRPLNHLIAHAHFSFPPSAAVTGLSNNAPHKLAFRLQLRGGAGGYPKGDGSSKDGAVLLLFGTPQAGAAFPLAVEQAAALAALAALEMQGQESGQEGASGRSERSV